MSYFDELFGTPELTRLKNWDGREEPVPQQIILMRSRQYGKTTAAQAIQEAWARDTSDPTSTSYGMSQPPETIDIDYEEVT